ncbi:VOC family protein [Starkeya sp. ORNL1]|uniref:VOC family protein n=1 Tax=Starkeya sp. ORNL1 TaxID=2709380 RepID=UPI0014633536|nr:VOC family protein [Starkeya sp. ORNL1]QJP15523.1 VOC family protein [Starkeya sp. ORNL1]
MQLLVNIDVPDFEAARTFYLNAFPLTEGRRFGEGMVELVGTSCAIYLLVKPAGSKAVPGGGVTRSYERHWTPVHLDIVVEDIEPALARALEAGAILEAPLRDENWGRIAGLADPFGNGFCLIEFSALGYNAIALVGGE